MLEALPCPWRRPGLPASPEVTQPRLSIAAGAALSAGAGSVFVKSAQ